MPELAGEVGADAGSHVSHFGCPAGEDEGYGAADWVLHAEHEGSGGGDVGFEVGGCEAGWGEGLVGGGLVGDGFVGG